MWLPSTRRQRGPTAADECGALPPPAGRRTRPLRGMALQRGSSSLRVVSPPRGALERSFLDRPLVYEKVMRMLGDRIVAAHQFLRDSGDVLTGRLPADRPLQPTEVEELAWRVYALTIALRLSFVRCHPSVVLLAGEWWHSDHPEAWEWFCQAHSG